MAPVRGPAVLLSVALVAGTAGFIHWIARTPGPAQITLDASTRFQVIDGWGMYPRYWEDNKGEDRFDSSFEAAVGPVTAFVVDSIGINAVRLEVWSGMENPVNQWAPYRAGKVGYREWAARRYEKINDNADPEVANLAGFRFEMFDYRFETMVAPILRALKARGEKAFLSLCYVDFRWNATTVQGSLSHADHPAEYAELIEVYFEHLRDKYGVTPDAFELVLEPDNTAGWRGGNIGRALVAVSERLKRHGFAPELIAPSASRMERAVPYFDDMMAVPGVRERLGVFSYHRYGRETVEAVRTIAARAGRFHLKTAMAEKVDAGIDQLLEDLTVGQVSSWQQWALAGHARNLDNGGYYVRVDDRGPGPLSVAMGKHSAGLAQVFRFVRRGAVRIGTRSDDADKHPVAFINTDGGWVVVVRARRSGGAVLVRGLPPGRYGFRFTGDDGKSTEAPPVNVGAAGALETRMAAAGVLTVFALDRRGAPTLNSP